MKRGFSQNFLISARLMISCQNRGPDEEGIFTQASLPKRPYHPMSE